MEGEPQPPRLSGREQAILRIRTQLEHIVQFERAAAGNTKWLEELAAKKKELEAELEKLGKGEKLVE